MAKKTTGARKGMGFDAAASSVQRREGVSAERARAIVAAGARKASAAAVRANPNLRKVSGNARTATGKKK